LVHKAFIPFVVQQDIVMVVNVSGRYSPVRNTPLMIQRVSACPVRMLRMTEIAYAYEPGG